MKLSTYEVMDPHLLYGLVNTELRNHSENLEDLCKTHGISVDTLKQRLAAAGYEYVTELKQFR